MNRTLVFKSRQTTGLNIFALNQTLSQLSIRPAREIGKGQGMFEVPINNSNRQLVIEVMKNQGLDLVEMSDSAIHAMKINHISDCITRLADALQGRYRSPDEPEWSVLVARQALENAIAQACDSVPNSVLATSLEAAARSMRTAAN